MVTHDQGIRVGELRLSASLAVGGGFGVELELPLRVFDTDITYRDVFGDAVALTTPNVHHRDETLTGLGDPWLLGVWRRGIGPVVVGVRAGASLPLGGTEPDPFALGDMGLEHEHFQFGTGTLDPIVGADARWRLGRVQLFAWALTKQTFHENGHGYQAGDRYAGGLGGESPVGPLRLRLGLDAQRETAETWQGVKQAEEGNLGRTDVLISLGARVPVGDVGVDLTVRVPLVQDVEGGQIDMPLLVELGVSYAFDLWGHAGHEHHHEHGEGEEHEHEHGDEHEPVAASAEHDPPVPPGADVADLTNTGEAVPLHPVPGKITVFDFWAPWCKPCTRLTPALYELAARYPDRLAVRRINVVDWDSPAAAMYLTPGGFSLPHIKVLGPDRTILLEQSSSPEALVENVKALLE
jgi:thiol-disulfide isomerase/thioredoxin